MKPFTEYFLFPLIFVTTMIMACTENQAAKRWGGTMKVDLPCGEKLFDLTWKGENFWYATRPMRKGETPETYKFHEKPDGLRVIGAGGGTVLIKECKK